MLALWAVWCCGHRPSSRCALHQCGSTVHRAGLGCGPSDLGPGDPLVRGSTAVRPAAPRATPFRRCGAMARSTTGRAWRGCCLPRVHQDQHAVRRAAWTAPVERRRGLRRSDLHAEPAQAREGPHRARLTLALERAGGCGLPTLRVRGACRPAPVRPLRSPAGKDARAQAEAEEDFVEVFLSLLSWPRFVRGFLFSGCEGRGAEYG